MPAVLGAAAATEAIRRAGARAAARLACGGRKGRARVGTGRVVRRLAAERGDAPQLIKIVGAKAAGRQHAELARELAEGLLVPEVDVTVTRGVVPTLITLVKKSHLSQRAAWWCATSAREG